jgi:hypothetical protein
MKLLIAVKSCQADQREGFHDPIRSTWGQEARALGIDVRFMMGANSGEAQQPIPQRDEMYLNCGDRYSELPEKTQQICLWMIGKVYDFVYLCDTDTYVRPAKLLASGFEKYDYTGKIDKPLDVPFYYQAVDRSGHVEVHEKCYPWASGGFGYTLSRKAALVIGTANPISWAEDLGVGNLLAPDIHTKHIKTLNVPGLTISHHYSSETNGSRYHPDTKWMEYKHAQFS